MKNALGIFLFITATAAFAGPTQGEIAAKDYIWNPDGTLVILKPVIRFDGRWRDIEVHGRPNAVCRMFSEQYGLDLPVATGSQFENENFNFSRYNVKITESGEAKGMKGIHTLTVFTEITCGPKSMEEQYETPDYFKPRPATRHRRGILD